MIELAPAAALLDTHAREIADEWERRCRRPGEDTGGVRARSRAVVAAICHAMDAPSDRAEEQLEAAVGSILQVDPEFTASMEQMAVLRLILHRTLVVGLPAHVAIAAVERVNSLVDLLVVQTSGRSLRVLEEAAFIDPLTGLWNRRALDRDGERAVAQAARYGRPLSVVALDVDRLKVVNDQQGHAAGDDLLRRLSHTLTRELRSSDTAYRIGGDEFVLLLPETDPAQAMRILERAAVEAPSFTYGVAACADESSSLESVLAEADDELMARKRSRPPVMPVHAPARVAGDVQGVPIGRWTPVIAGLPVIGAVLLAELARRALGISIAATDTSFWWFAMLAVGVGGSTYAWRRCRDDTSALHLLGCSVPVGAVILAVLLSALGPLDRRHDAALARFGQVPEPVPDPARTPSRSSATPRSTSRSPASPSDVTAPSTTVQPPAAGATADASARAVPTSAQSTVAGRTAVVALPAAVPPATVTVAVPSAAVAPPTPPTVVTPTPTKSVLDKLTGRATPAARPADSVEDDGDGDEWRRAQRATPALPAVPGQPGDRERAHRARRAVPAGPPSKRAVQDEEKAEARLDPRQARWGSASPLSD
jgi:diguanylate cyclase (GGDEF)-like protein